MADKSISELTAATQVGSTDLFVLEQSGVAKKLTGQILENWLVALADGHGGIQDIEKTSTSGLIDTYTITLADETVETFTVTNGKAISSVVKTGAVPPSLTDSYRINYNDGTHYDFTVTNGKGVTSIEKTSTSGLVDTYTITYNDSTTGTITVTNGKAITSITDKWAVSSSNTQTPSTWYNAAPEMTPTNRYLWHYQVIAYNDNTSVDTTKAVVGVYGDTGDAWYMWIKYAANEPTQDSDMVTIPNKWIGIYSGTSSTAPVHYTSYDWYEYKGEKGDTGDAAEVTSTAIVYQASESGTTVPTGTWVDTVPTVVQGQFLWTRVTVNWNDGTSAVWYSVSYVAIDGEGSPGSQTPLVDSGSGVVGTATAYSRQDHQHPLNVPSSGEPAMDGTASRGNADTYSRSDHVHPTDTSRARVADMAAAYSQRTYAKGELCIYENVLYRCKDGIPTAEAWNSSHWETTNIGVELGDLNGAITKNNISETIFKAPAQADAASDLNSVPFGYSTYTPNTSNIPYAGTWGTVFYYTASDTNWQFQEAFDTSANVWVRRKINAGNWTTWEKVITESKLRSAIYANAFSDSYTTQDGFTINVDANMVGITITVNESSAKSLTGRSGWTSLATLPSSVPRPQVNNYVQLFTPDTAISFATILYQPNGALGYQPHTVSNAWLQSSASLVIF